MECKDQEEENHLLEEVLGEFNKEVSDEGKCRISAELDKVRNKLETIRGFADELKE